MGVPTNLVLILSEHYGKCWNGIELNKVGEGGINKVGPYIGKEQSGLQQMCSGLLKRAV